jgi:hypothetical protein
VTQDVWFMMKVAMGVIAMVTIVAVFMLFRLPLPS